ncbi:MAG TPA: PhzF family phenazine biosynthesis protein [Chloroflexi bacterium]|jgi:PhzF family phenazine biosynthesis protein|nr:PhzF family phenazine biosynthesis protein [Chloroflexota bacterium]
MRIYQVDAFTAQPFKGNPAGVCLLDVDKPDAWMQSVASEMNLSETAFVVRQEDGFGLRWFTPTQEVGLRGHATLATAHILWEEGRLQSSEEARFDTRSGRLTASRDGVWISMDFPAHEVTAAAPDPTVNRALGVEPVHTAVAFGPNGHTYLLELASEEAVCALAPDFVALAHSDAQAAIVTARAEGGGYDFVSRFFAPAIGIDEDPVTGAAHCSLAPYWAARLGKNDLLGYQASARGGLVGCRWQDGRVVLRGRAVTVLRGDLLA